MSNQFSLAQLDIWLYKHLKANKENRMHLTTIFSAAAKCMNNVLNYGKYFSLQTYLQTCFHIVGYLV